MIVTQLVELSKTRSKVYIDQEFAFVLYKGELRLYKVREGQELSQAQYDTICRDLLPKRAKLRAMNLLKSRDYTTEELRKKLKQGFYPEPVIEQALQYVTSFGYVDDLRYAVSYLQSYEGSKSVRRIQQDLQKKGISSSIWESAYVKWQAEGGTQDESEMINKLLHKRHYHSETADFKEKQKTFAFLMRKGFSADAIRRALEIVED